MDVHTVTIEERSVPDPGSEEVLVRTARTLLSTDTEPSDRAPELYADLLADSSEAIGIVLEW